MSEQSQGGGQPSQNTYDIVAYPQMVCSESHPDRLAVMATLHGLAPAPIATCRVLEVGCNSGGNLLPMAYAIPQGTFVGFDLAQAPIERAQMQAAALGLKNARFFQGNIMAPGEGLGEFDYIIAHGVYGWVPDPVRDALFALCRDHLAPNGIAYVSYDALPGSHIRWLTHDLLRPLVRADRPAEYVQESSEVLGTVINSLAEGLPMRTLLEQEREYMRGRNPVVTFHDNLSEAYRPEFFVEFAARAARYRLQYVSSSRLPPPQDPSLDPKMRSMAKEISGGDRIREEHFYDLVKMRKFRTSLLCRSEQCVSPEAMLDRLRGLRLASRAEHSRDERPEFHVYTLPDDSRVRMDQSDAVLMMKHLVEAWPCSVPFTQMESLVSAGGFAMDEQLLGLLVRLVFAGIVELRTWDPPVSPRIADRPKASAWCRHEGKLQDKVASLLHSVLSLEDARVHRLLDLLDGQRDRNELARVLRKEEAPNMSHEEVLHRLDDALRLLDRAGALICDELDAYPLTS